MAALTVHQQDYIEGFDEQGNPSTTVLPTVTELNQAILVDDMPALAGIQLGPTGRAVSRSYAATLSKLVPRGEPECLLHFPVERNSD